MNLVTPSELQVKDREPVPTSVRPAPIKRRGLPVGRVVLLVALLAGAAFLFKGHGVKTWMVSLIRPAKVIPLATPTVSQSRPTEGEDNVLPESPITVNLNLPNGRLDKTTLLPANVSLVSEEDGVAVVTSISASTGGGTITLQPETPLSPNTPYALRVRGLKDFRGMAVAAYSASFTTAAAGTKPDPAIRFEKVRLPDTAGIAFTCVEVGPDHKLYASADDGRIFRFDINADGTLSSRELIDSLQTAAGGRRLVTGFCFDPASTPQEPILWVSNGFYAFENAPDWSGKITRMSGPGLSVVQDVVIDLPRSYRDHMTNQPSFGPDGALYFPQGSSSAYGSPDSTWGNRVEHLLNATVLRLDVSRVTPGQPIDVKTKDAGGSYDPYAPGSPLTIYATGIRNAFDLVWHSNGHLYVPTNGSSPGGNTPAGAGAPGLTNLPVSEDDWLFKITPGKYYGHPNPVQGHFVLNGGNPLGHSKSPGRVPQYPAGTNPDPQWEPAVYVFGKHVSSNGVIEYRGNAFGGALNHKLLVCRYNVGSDIIVLSLDAAGNVSQAMTGMAGMSHFANPLDLIEDPLTGNLYVCEYGGRKITLLRPVIDASAKVGQGER
jgi:glucose/arabinose dehydrogenase